jgi:hypothetical protein
MALGGIRGVQISMLIRGLRGTKRISGSHSWGLRILARGIGRKNENVQNYITLRYKM